MRTTPVTLESRVVEAKPIEQIRGSLARKGDADLVTVVDDSGAVDVDPDAATGTGDDAIPAPAVDAIRATLRETPDFREGDIVTASGWNGAMEHIVSVARIDGWDYATFAGGGFWRTDRLTLVLRPRKGVK